MSGATGETNEVVIDGVRWEVHSDGARTTTIGGDQFLARRSANSALNIFRVYRLVEFDSGKVGWSLLGIADISQISAMAVMEEP